MLESNDLLESDENKDRNEASLLESNIPNRLNKTEKKLLRYKKKLEKYRIKKEEKKKLKKKSNEHIQLNNNEETKPKSNVLYDVFYNKRELKKIANERLEKVYKENGEGSLKLCIDCSFSNKMSDKELSRFESPNH